MCLYQIYRKLENKGGIGLTFDLPDIKVYNSLNEALKNLN
jgi:hypothetical protein